MGKRWALWVVLAIAGTAGSATAQQWSPANGWVDAENQRRVDEAMRQADEEMARWRAMHPLPRHDMEPFKSDPITKFVPAFIMLCGMGVFVGMIGMLGGARRRRRAFEDIPAYAPEPGPAAPVGTVDVSVLRIAIDGRASKFVEDELARIRGAYETTSADGRSATLREVGVLLRRVRDSWIYGGAVNEPMGTWEDAKVRVRRHVDDARARFAPGAVAPREVRASDQTVVVVTIVVAARGELVEVSEIGAGEDLRRALEAAAHRAASELLAVEIVSSPRTTSIELEAAYPPPAMYVLAGSMAGKVFCDHCGGPFPGELVTCPHCGAPAPGRRAA